MIAIVDYGAGNQTSVLRALVSLGIDCIITDKPEDLNNSSGIIIPGVGSAGHAMQELKDRGLDTILLSLARKKPILGICIGCQIMLESSAEIGHSIYTSPSQTFNHTKNGVELLSIFKGMCAKFSDTMKDSRGLPLTVPHMGWNNVHFQQNSILFKNIEQDSCFYFVHSYYPVPEDKNIILAKTNYGIDFGCVFGENGLWAVQFHPEKSGKVGLQLLKNFCEYCK